MRRVLPINDSWKYSAHFEPGFTQPGFDDARWEDICLPHSNIELPFNGFDEKMFQFVSCYRRTILIPPEAAGQRVLLHFEGVSVSCRVYVNGVEAGGHLGAYTGFDIDISTMTVPGDECEICVMVDSREDPRVPPYGKVVDYLGYGGIYREAQLCITGKSYLSDLRMRSFSPHGKAVFRVFHAGTGSGAGEENIELEVHQSGRMIANAIGKISPGLNYVDLNIVLSELELWDIENPVRATVVARLIDEESVLDETSRSTGFRTAEFKSDGFYLNGNKVQLTGLNRHQSYPYAGYAMPARVQARDADILKYELGVNLVRTSHYPQSRHFLDRCDEIGLLVMEEIPGWQFIGDQKWQDQTLSDLEDMLINDSHHPSIILWGVRINESQDNHDFYIRTNALARETDPLRQTGGVRDFPGSEVLEDVYTINDFIHDGIAGPIRPPHRSAGRSMPYLITEHNGHMYPTKRFDQEHRLVEHALRHARVIDAALRSEECSGAIGWCAFDYNTHQEFGSGDRICYHGVLDMFRIPKYAGHMYASQQNPEILPVMHAASLFEMGERDEAKNLPIYVFTNCDFVRLYRNDEFVGDYLRTEGEFPGLQFPPIVIDQTVGTRLIDKGFSTSESDFLKRCLAKIYQGGIGSLSLLEKIRLQLILWRHKLSFSDAQRLLQQVSTGWGDGEQRFRLEGHYRGEVACVSEYGSSVPARLRCEADDDELKHPESGEAWDATRIVFSLEDQFGHVSPFVGECIEIELEGPGELVGPSRVVLAGGVCATWLRTSGQRNPEAKDGREIHIRGVGTRFVSNRISVRLV